VSVSIKLGGTTIPKPEEKADLNYLVSTCECSHLIDALKGKELFDPVFYTATMKAVQDEMKKKKLDASDEVLKKIEREIDKKGARRLNHLKERDRDLACSDPQLHMWYCSLCSRIQR